MREVSLAGNCDPGPGPEQWAVAGVRELKPYLPGKPLSELVRLGPKFTVAESFELRLQLVHTIDELLEFLQLLSLTGAEDFAEDRHERNILGVC